MRWPSPQDYREAIQNPQICLSDPDLRQASLELDALELPVVRSGQYASVFKLSTPSNSWAVRCFLHNFADRTERYRKISEFIIRDNLECTVGFELIDKGIRVADTWFPILKMEYVDGETMGSYIRNNLHDTEKLRSLRTAFGELLLSLKSEGIAHGDLQHDNILVKDDGQLRLIDYDGMYVPELKGWHSNELGHRNYQHPARRDLDFDAKLDSFSGWLICGALDCLIENPNLYAQISRSDESLLLQREDFVLPNNSRIFYDLERGSPVQKLFSQRMRTLLNGTVENIPYIDESIEILLSLPSISLDALPAPPQRSPEITVADYLKLVDASEEKTGLARGQNPALAAAISRGQVPMVAEFPSHFLLDADYTEMISYKANIKKELAIYLEPAEEVLWSGGLSPMKFSSSPASQSGFRAVPILNSARWSYAFVFFLTCISFGRIEPFLFWLGFLGLLMITFFWIVTTAFKPVPVIEPVHAYYQLTDRHFQIATDGRSPDGSGLQWSVTETNIPIDAITKAKFYRANEGLKERVELLVKAGKNASIPFREGSIWLHGLTTMDRTSLMTRLRGLNIQCDELDRPIS